MKFVLRSSDGTYLMGVSRDQYWIMRPDCTTDINRAMVFSLEIVQGTGAPAIDPPVPDEARDEYWIPVAVTLRAE